MGSGSRQRRIAEGSTDGSGARFSWPESHRPDHLTANATEPAAWVRDHLDEVQKLRSERGVPLLDPTDPKTKERYGL
jgi:predicted nucleic acid-binding Zn ribbon protein